MVNHNTLFFFVMKNHNTLYLHIMEFHNASPPLRFDKSWHTPSLDIAPKNIEEHIVGF